MSDSANNPEALDGYYLYREFFGKKPNGRGIYGPPQPCRIWYGPPMDPDTGEELDRSWRWQATLSGEEVSMEKVWPWVGSSKTTKEEYLNGLAAIYDGYEQRTVDWETGAGAVESSSSDPAGS